MAFPLYIFCRAMSFPPCSNAGVEVVLLTDDDLVERIATRFASPGLTVEGLRIKQAEYYYRHEHHDTQWWLNFLRRAGGSRRINTEAMDAYIRQVKVEQRSPRRRTMYVPMRGLVEVLRSSSAARKALVQIQKRYTPGLYSDLFDRYKPDMVIANTPGWRIDRYICARQPHAAYPMLLPSWAGTILPAMPFRCADAACHLLVGKAERGAGARLGLAAGAGEHQRDSHL